MKRPLNFVMTSDKINMYISKKKKKSEQNYCQPKLFVCMSKPQAPCRKCIHETPSPMCMYIHPNPKTALPREKTCARLVQEEHKNRSESISPPMQIVISLNDVSSSGKVAKRIRMLSWIRT